MIVDSAEVAAGVRTRPAVFRSLFDHSGLTPAQLDAVVEDRGGAQGDRVHGLEGATACPWPTPPRRPSTPPRLLRVHAVTEGSGGVKPTRRRFGHVAADTREGMVDEGYPFRPL